MTKSEQFTFDNKISGLKQCNRKPMSFDIGFILSVSIGIVYYTKNNNIIECK